MLEEHSWSGVGSAAASLIFLWAVARDYFPSGLHTYLHPYLDKVWTLVYPYVDITFHEFSADRMQRSDVYAAIQTYLSATAANRARRLTADAARDSHHLLLSLDDSEQTADEFRGVKLWWTSRKKPPRSTTISWGPAAQDDVRSFRLTFHRSHRHLLDDYLHHVRRRGKEIEVQSRRRKLFTNNTSSSYRKKLWSHVPFEHPATFDSLALEPGLKEEILRDLDSFRNGKNFYKKIGKAWKRGYLLYGPPGTGKSTMIAAMANYMEYDVYDLELTAVKDNTELRKLLIETTSKSIVVIEDIDCSEDLSKKRKKKKEEKSSEENDGENPHLPPKEEESKGSKVTLSGLLNFIDGLWSTCGGERLIVFTTNHVEKLDPALIRRGRMDKHIELSYCGFDVFKALAKNYLDVDFHPLFETVRELLGECRVTPADVAENLMPRASSDKNVELCLESLIRALREAREKALQLQLQQQEEEGEETVSKGLENGDVKKTGRKRKSKDGN